jgi:hypothetical protein
LRRTGRISTTSDSAARAATALTYQLSSVNSLDPARRGPEAPSRAPTRAATRTQRKSVMASPRSRASQSHGRPKGSLKLSTDLAAVTTGRADDSYVDWERPVEQAFRRARTTALTSGGTIPDTADYHVVLEPENQVIGSVNEDSTPDFRTYRCGAPLGQPADARRSPAHRRQHHQAAGVRALRAGSALRRRYAIASGHPMLHNARARQPPRRCSQ